MLAEHVHQGVIVPITRFKQQQAANFALEVQHVYSIAGASNPRLKTIGYLDWDERTVSFDSHERWRRLTFGMVLRHKAQGLVEYGLIIALVAVLAIAGLIVFGPAVGALLSGVSGSI